MSHDRLMVISVAGFVVNLIGLFAFQHGGAGMYVCMYVCVHIYMWTFDISIRTSYYSSGFNVHVHCTCIYSIYMRLCVLCVMYACTYSSDSLNL